jgi:hypothetical protein
MARSHSEHKPAPAWVSYAALVIALLGVVVPIFTPAIQRWLGIG